jgi:hypothetical protein
MRDLDYAVGRDPHTGLSAELQNLLEAQVQYHQEKLSVHQRRLDRLADERLSRGYRFSLARVILNMAGGQLDGDDRKLLERCATLAGSLNPNDPQRVFIPWEMLKRDQRDLTSASAGSAGYLVASSYGAARDVLRGWSVAVGAGITVIDALGGDVVIPRVLTSPNAYALPTEGAAITESQPVLGQSVLSAKNLACFCEFSRQLAKQANAEALIRMVMLSALGMFLDRQILNGSGASGELMGIFNTAGVQTQSGTTLAHAGTTTMKKLSGEAGAMDKDLAFVSTPAVRQLLENRERATGNAGFVWQRGEVADVPAFASRECPSASMLTGPWPSVILGHWGPPGVVLEINPYDPAGFKAGIIQARMILTADMGVMYPSAFVKSTSIT